jgi:preprotein translocase subunit YajC
VNAPNPRAHRSALPIAACAYRVRATENFGLPFARGSATKGYVMLITPAFAQTAGAAGQGSAIASFLPLVLIFAIMYFLLIRPQQKKMKELKAMIDALRRGDQVLTGGGIVGKVTKVGDDNTIEVEIATGVTVKIVKSTIVSVMNKTEPAKA